MHRNLTLALWTSLAAVGATAMLVACSSDDDRAPSTRFEDCSTVDCTKKDAGPQKDTGPDVQVTDVKTYDGPVTTVHGVLWWLPPPNFNPFATERPLLQYPAMVRAFYKTYDYSATYDPDGGFSLIDVPQGEYGIMAEDIDGKNGLFSTLWPLELPFSGTMELAVISKPDIDAILASVTPPLTVNPEKAFLLVTVAAGGGVGGGVPDIVLNPPKPAEAVLYFADGKWQRDIATGTGGDGQAMIVNMDASPYPGDYMFLAYSKVGIGKGKTSRSFPVAQGAISFVYQMENWVPE
jgi:hypothetical protein